MKSERAKGGTSPKIWALKNRKSGMKEEQIIEGI